MYKPKVTTKSSLAEINAEIRRISRIINDRVYRAELVPDPTGLYAQGIARVAAYAETTNHHYKASKPRLSTSKSKSKSEAKKKLVELQQLEKSVRILSSRGQNDWYDLRIRAVNERTGLTFNRKSYEMLIRYQHTFSDSFVASSQLVEFFGTLAVTPQTVKNEIPFDIASYDDIVDYLQSTSFPADELREYIREFDTRKNTIMLRKTYIDPMEYTKALQSKWLKKHGGLTKNE